MCLRVALKIALELPLNLPQSCSSWPTNLEFAQSFAPHFGLTVRRAINTGQRVRKTSGLIWSEVKRPAVRHTIGGSMALTKKTARDQAMRTVVTCPYCKKRMQAGQLAYKHVCKKHLTGAQPQQASLRTLDRLWGKAVQRLSPDSPSPSSPSAASSNSSGSNSPIRM